MTNKTMNFEVKISKEREYKFDLEAELEINEENLDEELSSQPQKFAWFATMAAMARAKVERLEYDLEEFELQLDLKIRREADKDEKLTEALIKAKVRTDAGRNEKVERLCRAKEQAEIAQAAKDAFSQRKDCLISIGANRRAQFETSLAIRESKKK